MAKSQVDSNSLWREITLQVPVSRVRKDWACGDRPDLEVQLPGAIRVQRRIEQG